MVKRLLALPLLSFCALLTAAGPAHADSGALKRYDRAVSKLRTAAGLHMTVRRSDGLRFTVEHSRDRGQRFIRRLNGKVIDDTVSLWSAPLDPGGVPSFAGIYLRRSSAGCFQRLTYITVFRPASAPFAELLSYGERNRFAAPDLKARQVRRVKAPRGQIRLRITRGRVKATMTITARTGRISRLTVRGSQTQDTRISYKVPSGPGVPPQVCS